MTYLTKPYHLYYKHAIDDGDLSVQEMMMLSQQNQQYAQYGAQGYVICHARLG